MELALKHLFKINSAPFSSFHTSSVHHYLTKAEFQKSIQIAILGGHTRLGTYTSFLLKQNPLVSRLHLAESTEQIPNVAIDLNTFDTKCQVETYFGSEECISKAIKGADVILILPTEECNPATPLGERIMIQGKRLYNFAKQCTIYAPRALIVVNVPPISVSVPLVSEVFKQKSHFYHPGRIIGSAAYAQIKANTLVSRFQGLDPAQSYVPILGGPDLDLCVPLFSQGKPVEVFDRNDARILTAHFRDIDPHDFPKCLGNPNYVPESTLSESYALNQLLGTIALGICGHSEAFANVYVRCKALDICKYLVTMVRFSRGVVVDNFEVPKLTKLELELLEKATMEILERERMAMEFLAYVTKSNNKSKNSRVKLELPPFKEKEIEKQELLKERLIR